MNVPPIPPLLCSTPPPIDFGDDDDDVLPPALDGDVDEEFGDFSGGDMKLDEPLPSPRPPSVTDLPPVSIYDGFVPHDDDTLLGTANEPSKKSPQTTPIVEAFNYSIMEQGAKEFTEKSKTEESNHNVTTFGCDNENLATTIESQQVESTLEYPDDASLSNASQINEEKEKTIDEPSLQEDINTHIEIPISRGEVSSPPTADVPPPPITKLESNAKPTISPLTNIVSIEDLEDDLSEDELYSPRTPKNLTEADVTSNDFFKIQEIEHDSNVTNVTKTSSDTYISKKSPDNFVFGDIHEPPPLDDVPPIDDNNDVDDDFGDFADFQDFSSNITAAPTTFNNPVSLDTTPVVPVAESKIEQCCNDTEDDFDDFIQHSHSSEEFKGEHYSPPPMQENNQGESICPSDDDDFDDFTSACAVNTVDLAQTDVNEKVEAGTASYLEDKSNEVDDDSFGNFDDIPIDAAPALFTAHKSADIVSNEFSHSQCDENDDFGDFADFSAPPPVTITNPPQVPEKSDQQTHNEVKKSDNVEDDFDEDDDDFGDFNTAEPITPQIDTTTTKQQTSQALSSNTPTSILQTPTNLNERISTILELMFSTTAFPSNTPSSNDNDTELKKRKIQDIPFTSIDAAKALEYQWLNSETRHAFIKSLGIDSRNILYGENWNPSLPRFAANLSFNPLKPMKPVSSNSGTNSSTNPPCPPSLDTAPVGNKDLNNPINDHRLAEDKKDTADLNWKMSSTEQKSEALNDNTNEVRLSNNTSSTTQVAASLPYVSSEPPESLTIFDNPLDIEADKFSKTPPICEMESVNSFSSPIPSLSGLEIDMPPMVAAPIVKSMKNLDLNEPDNSDDILEVVTSTTFSGSFKETHIYTPPKTQDNSSSTPSSTSTTSPAKTNNIDFDYEKAAMGVIIDETVVKKEYRDIEYNPPFTRESLTRTPSLKTESVEASNNLSNQTTAVSGFSNDNAEDDFNDEFTEFQSVPSVPAALPITNVSLANNSKPPTNTQPNRTTSEISKTSSCGMILSPAILIPQAISMESNKPKIEWGDSTASINPEELARIEELFPEPTKVVKSNNTTNSSQKSTPTHQATAPNTISATVANREFEGINNGDDDDWSDFISVPVAANNNNNNTKAPLTNNNASTRSQTNSPFKQRSPLNSYKMPNYNNSSTNDDEWSDFVSSAPSPAAPQPADMASNVQGPPPTHRVPQFNSGAWQNANFYNNPLSLYHKGPLNLHSGSQQSPKTYLNNNNYNQFQTANIAGHQQQIHVMQNFSTAPVPNATADRLGSSASKASNQFQMGSSVKVAPSIALIPDLGFVAPAIPTHTSFINSLPKPSINTKK
ncbi:mucin-2 [Musca vetustissima]|uniref:mucin-2 n=1 Tax=Musca vetustissima TaxID=27455 RepID=UPI002AB7BCE6|nr:mucin-2 [Musca vetustissima]